MGKNVSPQLTDQVDGTEYSISHQSNIQQPKVSVEESRDGNTITYTVTIDGEYTGFRANSGDNANITLINWKPKEGYEDALLPKDGITRPGSKNDQGTDTDYTNATYINEEENEWLGGYQIKGHLIDGKDVISDYLNKNPWSAKVSNANGFNLDAKQGYWIDMTTNNKPMNKGYVDSYFYGFVYQFIHFVDEQGNPIVDEQGHAVVKDNQAMVGEDGQPIADITRVVKFRSKEDKFSDNSQFDDIHIPQINDYNAYVGVKDATDVLSKKDDGKAAITGNPITKHGYESPFTFPHSPFVEYVVYVKGKPTQVIQSFTVTENISYRYANGPKQGQEAATPYTHKVTYTRTRYIYPTTGGVYSDWTKWTPNDPFAKVTSPEIANYHLADSGQSVINAPHLSRPDFQDGQSKSFNYVVDYLMDEPSPTPDPNPQPKPDQPDKPNVTPNNHDHGKQTSANQPRSNNSATAMGPSQTSHEHKTQLPQTGNGQSGSLLGLGILSLLAALGLAKQRRAGEK